MSIHACVCLRPTRARLGSHLQVARARRGGGTWPSRKASILTISMTVMVDYDMEVYVEWLSATSAVWIRSAAVCAAGIGCSATNQSVRRLDARGDAIAIAVPAAG